MSGPDETSERVEKLVDEVDDQLADLDEQYRSARSALSSQPVPTSAAMSAGERERLIRQTEVLKAEQEQLGEELAARDGQVVSLRKQIHDLEMRIAHSAQLGSRLSAAEDQGQREKLEADRLRAVVEARTIERDELSASLRSVEVEKAQLRRRVEELQQDAEESEAEKGELRRRAQQAETTAARERREHDQQRIELETLTAQRADLSSQALRLKEDLAAFEARRNELEALLERRESEIKHLKKVGDKNHAELSSFRAISEERDALRAERDKLRRRMEAVESELTAQTSEAGASKKALELLAARTTERDALERSARDMSIELSQLRGAVAEVQGRHDEVRMLTDERNGLERRVVELEARNNALTAQNTEWRQSADIAAEAIAERDALRRVMDQQGQQGRSATSTGRALDATLPAELTSRIASLESRMHDQFQSATASLSGTSDADRDAAMDAVNAAVDAAIRMRESLESAATHLIHNQPTASPPAHEQPYGDRYEPTGYSTDGDYPAWGSQDFRGGDYRRDDYMSETYAPATGYSTGYSPSRYEPDHPKTDYAEADYASTDYAGSDHAGSDHVGPDHVAAPYEVAGPSTGDYPAPAEDYVSGDYVAGDYRTEGDGTDDYATHDYGTNDYGTDGYGTNDYGTNDYGTDGYATNDYGTNDYGTDGYGTNDYGTNDYGTDGYATSDYATNDYATDDYGTEGFGTEGDSTAAVNDDAPPASAATSPVVAEDPVPAAAPVDTWTSSLTRSPANLESGYGIQADAVREAPAPEPDPVPAPASVSDAPAVVIGSDQAPPEPTEPSMVDITDTTLINEGKDAPPAETVSGISSAGENSAVWFEEDDEPTEHGRMPAGNAFSRSVAEEADVAGPHSDEVPSAAPAAAPAQPPAGPAPSAPVVTAPELDVPVPIAPAAAARAEPTWANEQAPVSEPVVDLSEPSGTVPGVGLAAGPTAAGLGVVQAASSPREELLSMYEDALDSIDTPVAPVEEQATAPAKKKRGRRRLLGGRKAIRLPADVSVGSPTETLYLIGMPGVSVLVDGESVSGRGWVEGPGLSPADYLVNGLADLAARSDATFEVVFDAAKTTVTPTLVSRPRVRIRFAQKGVSVNDVITRLAETYPPDHPLVGATSDAALRSLLSKEKINLVTATQLADLVKT